MKKRTKPEGKEKEALTNKLCCRFLQPVAPSQSRSPNKRMLDVNALAFSLSSVLFYFDTSKQWQAPLCVPLNLSSNLFPVFSLRTGKVI